MKLQLEITIGADGQVRIVTHGLKGQECLAETKALESALGRVTRHEKTREFYQQAEKSRASVHDR